MKISESGRSMVEMLGVLAIIGILTITGIMGFQWAMTKHETNNLLNELRLCSAMAAGMRLTNPDAEPDMSEIGRAHV